MKHSRTRKFLPSRTLRRRLALVLLGLGLAVGAWYGLSWALSLLVGPHIDSLSPVVVDPGGSVTVKGRNFGAARGDSRVEIDGLAPTASSYLSWRANAITLRLPPGAESGLVYVVTPRGRSNAKLFMNRAKLPSAPKGSGNGLKGPYITSIAPESASIGALLVISGRNFGASRGVGSVLFSWSPEGSAVAQDDRTQTVFVSPSEAEAAYESWTDKEIRVRVPDGASSGSLLVDSGQGRSNAIFFSVTGMPGQKRFKDKRSYSLSSTVSLTKVKASGPNELDLWIPRPVESASQRISRVLSQTPAPLVDNHHGVTLYQFKDLSTGQDISVTQSWLVQAWTVETSVNPDKIQKPEETPPFLSAFLAPDALVPSGAEEVRSLALRITQGDPNPWRAARLVNDWLAKNILWAAAAPNRPVADVLTLRVANSDSFTLAACALLRAAGIPALPVKGYLVDPSRASFRHAWVEFYIYGLGWVPMDPILASGASPGNLKPAFEDRARYFGNLDNRHLAFSRGYAIFQPMTPQGRRASPQKPLTFQSFFEEASGSLEAYSTFWGEIEVSGLY